MSITIDYTAMFDHVVGAGNGIIKDMIEASRSEFDEIRTGLRASQTGGEQPFWDLPFDIKTIEEIESFAFENGNRYKNFVLLGIGGSALGPIALNDSLNHLHHNMLDDETRKGCRFFCPDNVDPDLMGALLDVIDPGETLFNVVSKSGGTAETIAQFLIIIDLLKNELGEKWRDHLVITTDSENGFLREFADREKVRSFAIHPGVGGRFSILTPVGLLPGAMIGIDIRSLCKGAAAMKKLCFAEKLEDNPSAMLAVLLYLAQTSLHKPIHVMFAYSNRLYYVADWFRQLWAESLGKRHALDGSEIFTGPTPVKAVGATDQHSQVQLYVEGPADKVVVFLGVKNFKRQVSIPHLGMKETNVEYLQGANLQELINAERQATAYALTKAGRPNMTIELDYIDARHVGALLYLLEAATPVSYTHLTLPTN